MPSIADGAHFSSDERGDMGGWLDAEATDMQRRAAMPNRYSDLRLQKALSLKNEIFQMIRMVLHRAKQNNDLEKIQDQEQ